MATLNQKRQQAWKEYVETNPILLIDALDQIRTNGTKLDATSGQVFDELMELLCQSPYVPQKIADFPTEFPTAVHAAAMRLCAECSGNILRIEDIEEILRARSRSRGRPNPKK